MHADLRELQAHTTVAPPQAHAQGTPAVPEATTPVSQPAAAAAPSESGGADGERGANRSDSKRKRFSEAQVGLQLSSNPAREAGSASAELEVAADLPAQPPV